MNKNKLGISFVERIRTEALESSAVHHPYLRALRYGDLPDFDWALKDFAFQYGLYSGRFVQYLSAVIERLSCEEHREILQKNLAEEQGNPHDIELPSDVLASIKGQPHTVLYQRFQQALGIDDAFKSNNLESHPAHDWSQQFLELCEVNEHVGLGAIGIGTELIVSSIYRQILDALKTHSHLTKVQRVFFELHSDCDDHHAEQILLIVESLANNSTACEQIEYGVRQAIEMRSAFWDAMLNRALNCKRSSAISAEELSLV